MLAMTVSSEHSRMLASTAQLGENRRFDAAHALRSASSAPEIRPPALMLPADLHWKGMKNGS
jgi:hypothetical protein